MQPSVWQHQELTSREFQLYVIYPINTIYVVHNTYNLDIYTYTPFQVIPINSFFWITEGLPPPELFSRGLPHSALLDVRSPGENVVVAFHGEIPSSWKNGESRIWGEKKSPIINPADFFNGGGGAGICCPSTKSQACGTLYAKQPQATSCTKNYWIMSNSTQVCYPQLEPKSSEIKRQPTPLFLECWANVGRLGKLLVKPLVMQCHASCIPGLPESWTYFVSWSQTQRTQRSKSRNPIDGPVYVFD